MQLPLKVHLSQSDLQDFENNLSKYVDAYVLGVGNATDALELLFHAKDIKENDDNFLFSHNGRMLQLLSLLVLFQFLVKLLDHLIDVEKIEGLITNKTRAIMPTHSTEEF